MNQLRRLPMGTLSVIVGAVSALAWITMEGTVPLVITIAAGSLIAVKATLEAGD